MSKSLQEAIGEIAEQSSAQATCCHFTSKSYTPILFNKLCFLTPNQTSSKITTYIDGGQQVIISSSSFLLGVIRVAASSWKGTQRAGVSRDEFLILIRPQENQYEMTFYTPEGESTIPYDNFFFNGEISIPVTAYDIEEAFAMARRNSELSLAVKQSTTSDVICLDGSLRTFDKNELQLIKELQKICKQNNTLLSGLQKTTSLMTDSGASLVTLTKNSPQAPWITSKLCENDNKYHLASIHAIRLHTKGRHVFVIDMMKDEDSQQVINELSANSIDPVFLGYPYGLVDADKLARLENSQREHYRLQVRKIAGKHNDILTRESSSKDAHEILDRMQF
ncbi:MAG: DNA double-strand break repair nuclease NurA [Nanobdellota archaeon]